MKDDRKPLEERVALAIERIKTGKGLMRIPAERSDPDFVICDLCDALSAARAQVSELQSQLATTRQEALNDAADLAEDWTCKRCDSDTAADLAMAIRNHDTNYATAAHGAGKSEWRQSGQLSGPQPPGQAGHTSTDGASARGGTAAERLTAAQEAAAVCSTALASTAGTELLSAVRQAHEALADLRDGVRGWRWSTQEVLACGCEPNFEHCAQCDARRADNADSSTEARVNAALAALARWVPKEGA
jgi:hypothetical protein